MSCPVPGPMRCWWTFGAPRPQAPLSPAGEYHVQGLASQFAALCLQARPGQRVLDLCAAPGGKSLTLAQQMENTGELVSGEVVPGRVALIEKAFARCGVTCARAVQNDAAVRFDWGKFDRVLCDVPCSGLGVIAKKPDIRYKDLDGMENLCAVQRKILQNGADSLAESAVWCILPVQSIIRRIRRRSSGSCARTRSSALSRRPSRCREWRRESTGRSCCPIKRERTAFL